VCAARVFNFLASPADLSSWSLVPSLLRRVVVLVRPVSRMICVLRPGLAFGFRFSVWSSDFPPPVGSGRCSFA
jgi:hypothetical protein